MKGRCPIAERQKMDRRLKQPNSLESAFSPRIDAVARLVCLGVCACHSWIGVCRQSISGRRNLCKDNTADVAFSAQDNYGLRLLSSLAVSACRYIHS